MAWDARDFVNDLDDFCQLTEKHDISIDVKGIHSLYGKLAKRPCFDINNLVVEFELEKSIAGTIPNNVGSYFITLTHKAILDSKKDPLKEDPFLAENGYELIIDMIGWSNDDCKEYHSSLRLDKHIVAGKPSRVCHPYYHFQFGGDSIALRDNGDLLLCSSPRIAHPPMDIFLGIHFVLDSYFDKSSFPRVKDFLEDYDYRAIIQRSQERLWEPYFHGFSGSSGHADYTMANIFPSFVANE